MKPIIIDTHTESLKILEHIDALRREYLLDLTITQFNFMYYLR